MRDTHPVWVGLANGSRVPSNLADMRVRILTPHGKSPITTYRAATRFLQAKHRRGQDITCYDIVDARTGRYVSWLVQ